MKTHPVWALAALVLAPLAMFAQTPPASPSSEAAPPAASSLPAPARSPDTLAVSDIKILPALLAEAQRTNTAGALLRLQQSLDSQLIAALGATRKFQLVGRSDLDALLKEQGLGQSGNVSDATAAKAFRLTGATYLLVTTIDSFQDRLETANFPGIGERAQRRKITLTAVAKIYVTETGQLAESDSIQIELFDTRNDPAYIQERGGPWADRLVVDAVRTAAAQIAQHVADAVFPCRVVAKTGTQITLNRGEGTGIAPGQIWTIYAVGKELTDPDTGASLGREQVPVGKAKITVVTPRTALAELTEDRGIAELNIARQDS